MSSPLTEDQLKKIEENRIEALKRLELKKFKAQFSNIAAKTETNEPNPRQNPGFLQSKGNQIKPISKLDAKTGWSINKSERSTDVPSVITKPHVLFVSSKPFLGNIHIEIESRDSFSVNDIPSLSPIFKSIHDFKYDSKDKKWIFLIDEYHNLIPLIKEKEPQAKIHSIPNSVLNFFLQDYNQYKRRKEIGSFTSAYFSSLKEITFDLTLIDEKLRTSLLPFQLAGLKFALEKQGRLLLADDMGLGKTIQALAIASFYRREWPLLIIVPASLVASWAQSIFEWLPSVPSESVKTIYTGNSNADGLINIVSYDLAVRLADDLKARKFEVIILDESHYLKNSTTKRTKIIGPIAKKSARTILLSGTPALSRPIELFSQIQIVNSKIFPNMTEYGIRYCKGYQSSFGWDFKGSSHLKELSVVLENTIMIRRLKQNVLSQLPSKRRQQVFLHIEQSKLKQIKQLMYDDENSVKDPSLEGLQSNALAMKVWRETGVVKLPAVQEYVFELFDKDEGLKILIFAHHQHVLDGLESTMWTKKIPFIRIDGSTASTDRQKFCSDFQENPMIKVALLSITAAGIGLTLTAASMVVFAELYWNPGVLIQAEDRAHRLGQKDSVNIHYLLAQETYDDKLWPLILRKLTVLESVGLTKNEFSGMNKAGEPVETQKSLLDFQEFRNSNH